MAIVCRECIEENFKFSLRRRPQIKAASHSA